MRKRGTRDVIILVVLLILGIAGTAVATRGDALVKLVRGNSTSSYETAKVERGTVSATVGATGSAHARQSAVLSWRVTGTIMGLTVKVGDALQAGTMLASLKDESVPANLILAYFDLIDARKAKETLLQSKTTQATAELALADAQKALEDALDAQSKLKIPNASPSVIELAKANLDKADAAVKQAEQLYSLFEASPQDDLQRLQAAANLERARRLREYAEINVQFAQNKPDLQTANRVNAQVEVAQANLADAQREWKRVKNGPSADDLKAAQARIDADQSTLALATLTTPISGTITQLNMMNGDAAQPGKPAVRVEDLAEMHIKVDVPEVDISRVKVGQKASVTFDAIRKRAFQGEVLDVAQFGTPRQGNTFFEVEVRLDNADQAIKTGMTGAVDITVDTAKNVLLVPNRALRSLKGQRVVYVLKNEQLVPAFVTLSVSNESMSAVTAGDLKEGDLIVLNPPSPTPGS